MKEKKYQRIVERHKPKEERAKFALISFIVGGLVGVLGEGLICFYVKVLSISRNDASTYMIVTLIFIASFLTALGVFDNLVKKIFISAITVFHVSLRPPGRPGSLHITRFGV